jgi:hypothetical protein
MVDYYRNVYGGVPGFEGYQYGLPVVGSGMPTSYQTQFSFGGIVEDLGEWIKTTGGELLRVVVDEFGRRVVQKTGEILAGTPVGTTTTYYTTRNALNDPLVIAGIGVVAFLLLRR